MHTETDGGETATTDRGDVATDGGDVAAASDGDEAGTDVGPDGGAAAPTGQSGLGRRILVSVGVIVILISGGLGWFVGSHGALDDAAVLGTNFSVPVTPGALALYGLVVSTAIVVGLFALVELASRLEGDGRAE